MRRLVVRLLLVVGLVLVPTVVLVAPAQADLCKDVPAPVAPKAGLPGLLTQVPSDIPSSAPDPFTDPKVAIGDVYGYSWHWSNYDLGCGSDFLRDPGAVTNTSTGNILLSIADAVIASLATLEGMAKSLPLDWLSEPLQHISAALKDQVLTLWFPLATVALAVLVLWRAKKASYHETAKVAGVFVVAVALAVFALLYPAVMSKQVDRVVTTVADVTGSTFSTSATDAINRESAYRTWLAGNFADPDGASAKEYGPRLMSATHYTWSDWKRIQDHPDAKASIDAAKAAEFKQVATALEKDDPASYEVFTGRGERTGPALFGILDVAAMGLFVATAALMILVARVMMQTLTLVAPLAAVVGILPKHHGVLAKLWDLFAASVVAVAKFTLAGGVMTVLLGAVQSADLSGAGRLFFVVVATVVGLVLTKPLHSLKTLVPGLDPNQSYLKKLVQHVGPALAGGAGSYAGVVNGMADSAEADDRYDLTGKPVTHRSQQEPAGGGWHALSLAALPAPTWTPQPLAAAPSEQKALPAASVEERPASTPSAAGVAAEPARAWPAPRLALTAAPAEHSDTVAPVTDDAVPSTAPPAQRPTPPPSSGPVVIPDGVITQSDPGQYHPGGPTEVYVPASELQLADDGTEHEQIVYHSPLGKA